MVPQKVIYIDQEILFFYWENEGKLYHVCIVVETKVDIILTIEGNSSNDSVQKEAI